MVLTSAALDANSKQTITARLNTDGLTIQRIEADSSHILQVSDGSTGADHGGTWAAVDANGRGTLEAVSNADGTSPIALYADSSGNLLVKST